LPVLPVLPLVCSVALWMFFAALRMFFEFWVWFWLACVPLLLLLMLLSPMPTVYHTKLICVRCPFVLRVSQFGGQGQDPRLSQFPGGQPQQQQQQQQHGAPYGQPQVTVRANSNGVLALALPQASMSHTSPPPHTCTVNGKERECDEERKLGGRRGKGAIFILLFLA